MTDSGISINVRGDAEVRATLNELGNSAKPALVSSINRTGRDLRSRMVKKTVAVYNISSRELSQYVSLRQATRTNLRGIVSLLIRAIPIEAFRPLVKMQAFTYQFRGKTITRKLPAIYLKRFKGGSAKYVAPAFPLRQRTSGALRRGEKVRRRTGSSKAAEDARRQLTRIRYYTFPQQFVDEQLLPDALSFIPERVSLELQRALRRFNSRGDRALRTPR